MPFFLPSRLVDLEYVNQSGEVDTGYEALAQSYADDIDFAFFVVNFHYTRSDYEQLTPRDKQFIKKAYENKTVKETTEMRNAVLNAVGNALRKKNSRFVHLWKKVQRPIDKEKALNDLAVIEEVEAKEGKLWVDLLYAVNGMEKPRKEGSDE